MVIILHDTPEGYPFVAERMQRPCRKIYSPQFKHKYLTWIAGAWRAVWQSRKDDIIISLYDFQGILCYWIGCLTFRRRKIVAINVLLKDKDTIRNKIATLLYRNAIKSKLVIATVSTDGYRQWIKSRLRFDGELPLLPDVFYESYLNDAVNIGSTDDGYIFSGGRNGRDWSFIINLATKLPNLKFKIVLQESTKQSIIQSGIKIPRNIDFHCDITMPEFNRLLSASSIVILPLDTKAPAGLIVLFQAGAYCKPVIITDTISTQGYISGNNGISLPNDVELWKESINKLIPNSHLRQELGNNLHNYIRTECNEQKYVDKINKIIETFDNNRISQSEA